MNPDEWGMPMALTLAKGVQRVGSVACCAALGGGWGQYFRKDPG